MYKRLLGVMLVEIALMGGVSAQTLDLATRTDALGIEHYVGFCARPSPTGALAGKPGHMFVSFSREVTGGQHEFIAVGHTTDAGGTAALTFIAGSVDGYLREEIYTDIQSDCLTVHVNKEDYDRATADLSARRELAGILGVETLYENYRLGAEDCMNFAISVAEKLRPVGLNVPSRGTTELPMTYMKRLIDANR